MANTLALDKLSGRYSEVAEMLTNGDTFSKIAEHFGISKGALINFVYQDDHSARTREILAASSESYVDKAEEVLINAPSDLVEIMRAKELSQFYRWKASKRNPKTFGNNSDVNVNIDIKRPMSPEQFNALMSTLEQKALPQETQNIGYEDVTDQDHDEDTKHEGDPGAE